jgi:hypothetical protein
MDPLAALFLTLATLGVCIAAIAIAALIIASKE